jgi:hypothetical protein
MTDKKKEAPDIDPPVGPMDWRVWVRPGPLRPLIIVEDVYIRALLLTFWIPLLFLAAKPLHFPLISESFAQHLRHWFSTVWPALDTQWMWIRQFADPVDANNYVLFSSLIFCLAALLVAQAIRYLLIRRKDVSKPTMFEFFILAPSLALLSLAIAVYDVPNPRGRLTFFVDPGGYYYLRQFILMLAAGMSISLLVVTLIFVFVFAKARRGTSSY